ncbi:MAG: HAD-IA family hydrolase [Rhodobacter sp.]|nr:HAD-IA family hydrolase [Rhodobacter sp.]
MTPRAIIFDCDGVLVDSEPAAFDLLAQDLAAHGLPLPRAEMERIFIGGTIAGVHAKARSLGAALPDGWVAGFYERLYARLAEGTPLVPGVLDLLDALDAAGIPYAVGSNGSDRKMQVTLGQHPGLLDRFRDRLFSGQTLGAPKPAPDLYLHAARALAQPPSACAVIEDSPTGVRAAAAAGIRCFGYAPHGDGAVLAAEGATVFQSMADLPRLLGL